MRRENVAIVFPGQGSQYIGMGQDLYNNFPVAKQVFEEVNDAINQKLSDLMFYGDREELNLTENAQPAIMACSIAAYRVLAEKNGADTMLNMCAVTAGHSLGEYSALCAAESISLTDTARLLKKRGLAMQAAAPVGSGGMLVLLGVDFEIATEIVIEAEKYGVCEVANDNCPGQIVISGAMQAIDYAASIASRYGCKKAIKLSVSAPFHCALMNSAAKVMEDELSKIAIAAPVVPVVSNYTARPNLSQMQILQLLVGQIPNVVRWTESVKMMLSRYNVKNFLEIGPGKVLSGLINRTLVGVNCMNFETTSDIMKIPSII